MVVNACDCRMISMPPMSKICLDALMLLAVCRELLTNESSQNGNCAIFPFYFSSHFFFLLRALSFSRVIFITGKSVCYIE